MCCKGARIWLCFTPTLLFFTLFITHCYHTCAKYHYLIHYRGVMTVMWWCWMLPSWNFQHSNQNHTCRYFAQHLYGRKYFSVCIWKYQRIRIHIFWRRFSFEFSAYFWFWRTTHRFKIIWFTARYFFFFCIFHQPKYILSRYCNLNGAKSYSYTSANLVRYKCRLINYHYDPICCYLYVKENDSRRKNVHVHLPFSRENVLGIAVHLICNRIRTQSFFFTIFSHILLSYHFHCWKNALE